MITNIWQNMSVVCREPDHTDKLELTLKKGIMQYYCERCGNFADSNSFERFIKQISAFMEEQELNDIKQDMTGWKWTDNTAKIRYEVIEHTGDKLLISIDNRKVPRPLKSK